MIACAHFVVGDLALRGAQPLSQRLPDASVLYHVVVKPDCAYVDDCIFDWLDAPQMARKIFEWNHFMHGNAPMFFEQTGWFDLYAKAIRDCAAPGFTIDVRPIPLDTTPNAKIIRIGNLVQEIGRGALQVKPGLLGEKYLIAQLRANASGYRVNDHDDFADALSQVPVILRGHIVTPAPTPQRVNPDVEPSAAGDPLGNYRWRRDHPQDDEGGTGFCF